MKYIVFILTVTVIVKEGFTPGSLALVLFILWSIPLNLFRIRFRKIVYKTDDWKIAISPVFIEEIKSLFGNTQPQNKIYLKARNFYRVYLIIFIILYLIWSQVR
ncbi:MAG: hypothetical protein ACI840_001287 [Ulvibacter sp.]|jgi:hypothetical protein